MRCRRDGRAGGSSGSRTGGGRHRRDIGRSDRPVALPVVTSTGPAWPWPSASTRPPCPVRTAPSSPSRLLEDRLSAEARGQHSRQGRRGRERPDTWGDYSGQGAHCSFACSSKPCDRRGWSSQSRKPQVVARESTARCGTRGSNGRASMCPTSLWARLVTQAAWRFAGHHVPDRRSHYGLGSATTTTCRPVA